MGGCIFCGGKGGGLQNLVSELLIREQVEQGIKAVKRKHKAKKFIVYFQNFTNTYLPLTKLQLYLEHALHEDVVEIALSTKPDCLNDKYLEFLTKFRLEKGVDISLEIGLQTVNYHTLTVINRGHTLAEFIDVVQKAKAHHFSICTHLILNLPWDGKDDVIESAKILSALEINQVKLHALFILPGTVLHQYYEKRELDLISIDEYIERVIVLLEYLDPKIVVQRLIGRSPEREISFVNWGLHWQEIRKEIEDVLEERDTYQGKNFNYLKGYP